MDKPNKQLRESRELESWLENRKSEYAKRLADAREKVYAEFEQECGVVIPEGVITDPMLAKLGLSHSEVMELKNKRSDKLQAVWDAIHKEQQANASVRYNVPLARWKGVGDDAVMILGFPDTQLVQELEKWQARKLVFQLLDRMPKWAEEWKALSSIERDVERESQEHAVEELIDCELFEGDEY